MSQEDVVCIRQDQLHRALITGLTKIGEKNYVGSEHTPYINEGKGDKLAQRAVSLLHHKWYAARWPARRSDIPEEYFRSSTPPSRVFSTS
eukprot:1159610-Pelagomonas_calceolata.AAC.3